MATNETTAVVVRTPEEVASMSLADAAAYMASLDNQTRSVARQRAGMILSGEDAPAKCRELLGQLSTFCDRMNRPSEWNAMALIDRALQRVSAWEMAQDEIEVVVAGLRATEATRTLDEMPEYQAAVNYANACKLDAHSHLVHLGSRLPSNVRDNPKMSGTLRQLRNITAATRYAPIDYIPGGNEKETGREALARLNAADVEAANRRKAAQERRDQRLLEAAQAVAADKTAAEASK